jgi:hypothetical protein
LAGKGILVRRLEIAAAACHDSIRGSHSIVE